MSYHKVLEKVEQIPFEPGCYLYKNASGEIIYVGKAKILRKRVRQYFDRDDFEDPKIEVLRSQIVDIEWITVKTETEAFILESNLIKKYRPKFNKLQKDDKRYAWIKITNEAYPRILRVREKKRDKAEYFGPYPNGSAARTTLNFLRKIYPYRVCTKRMYSFAKENDTPAVTTYKNINGTLRSTKTSRLCLDYHLGLCNGACDNLVSPEDYGKSIEKIRAFLKGNQIDVLKDLNKKMRRYASEMEFEEAASIRDRINELSYIGQKIRIKAGQDEDLVRAKKQRDTEDVAKHLFEKLNVPNYSGRYRIECYDVSNIQGTNPITSMVVFENGVRKNSDYRFFRIRLKETPDDFHMMEEGLERRLKYLTTPSVLSGHPPLLLKGGENESFDARPDLIIVDGGKGQLSIALGVVEKFGLDICVVGIAKQEEEIIQRVNGVYKTYRLRKDSKILHLVQNLRDEAHRFAITRHRNLRGKKALQSVLTEIPGVGQKSVEKLLKHFGTVDNIKQAKFEELAKVLENKAKAADVIKFFK